MGNTEAKQLVQPTPLNRDEIIRLQKMHATYGSSLVVDGALFASLFNTGHISFPVIDRLFAAFEKNALNSIDLAELVVGLILCDRGPCEEKLKFLFAVLDNNGERKLMRRELQRMLGVAIQRNVTRLRGGKAGVWEERECAACKGKPSGSIYTCIDCCKGYILGVPITVCLCADCHATWEGVLEEAGTPLRHYRSHRLVKQEVVPSGVKSGQIYHMGVQCDSCGTLPILGPRFHCLECKDILELCETCHEECAEPLSHSVTHVMDSITTQHTIEQQVKYFLDELFIEFRETPDSLMTLAEFLEWGLNSELMTNILNGLEIQYVYLSPFEESLQIVEEVYHQDPDVGRVEMEEMYPPSPANKACGAGAAATDKPNGVHLSTEQ